MAQLEAVPATAAMARVQDLAESLQDGKPPPRYILPEPLPSVSEDLPAGDIPVVDLSRVATDTKEAAKLKAALGSWGLFHAVGHEIPLALLDAVLEVGRDFFRLSPEEKHRYFTKELEGYGNERVLSDQQVLDWTDRLYLLVDPIEKRKLKLWPDTPADFSDVLSEYGAKTKDIVHSLLVAMARLLPGLDAGSFVEQLGTNPDSYARFNFYPRCSRPELVYGIKPHADGSLLTVVLPDPEVDGLQVLQDGKWFRVPAVPGALVINVGDQLEIMSNGAYNSPIHRVVTSARKERISLAMFYAADPEQEIGPAETLIGDGRPRLYRNVKVKEYLEYHFQRFYNGERSIDWARATDPSAPSDA